MKREILGLIIGIFILTSIACVSASLDIEKKAVNSVIITELKNPAVFDFSLKNNGADDTFTIYNLIGFSVEPSQPFGLGSGGTKDIQFKFYPSDEMLKRSQTINFLYKIKGEAAGIQEDSLTITITKLKDAFDINAYNINLDSDTATVYIRNKVDYEFKDLKVVFKSSFFDFEKTVTLKPYEKQEFNIELNRDQIKSLVAGQYYITSDVSFGGFNSEIENNFKFIEKSGISTDERTEGIIIRKTTITKTNDGNMPSIAEVTINKNAFSRLFTTLNMDPVKVERNGFNIEYTFKKELKPSEVLVIRATTNWTFPIVLLLVILGTAYLVSIYRVTFVSVKKKTTYVKTKGGEFALKVTLLVKARDYVEKLNIVDRIPYNVKVYDRFGAVNPDKIDEKNRRLEWSIPSLNSGEERVFSYVIYSKVGVVGKFELPTASAIYEHNGKLHESESNKVYFLKK